MTTELARPQDGAIVPANGGGMLAQPLERVALDSVDKLLNGNIAALSPPQRISYMMGRCEALGLDYRTRPFILIKDERTGAVSLYLTAEAAFAVGNARGISLEVIEEKEWRGCYLVRMRGRMPNGRTAEQTALVPLQGRTKEGKAFDLTGVNFANAIMKTHTKAARRVIGILTGFSAIEQDVDLTEFPNARMATITEDGEIVDSPALTQPALPESAAAETDAESAETETEAETPASIGAQLSAEWLKHHGAADKCALREYAERALGRPVAEGAAEREADMQTVLSDLRGRLSALRGLYACFDEAGGDRKDDAEMRRQLSDLLGRPVASRATLTTREMQMASDLIRNGALGEPATAPVADVTEAPDPFEDGADDLGELGTARGGTMAVPGAFR